MGNVHIGGGWGADYLVKLESGRVLVMSPDELDEAFEAGHIGERTPVLAPGGTSWTTIARLGGFDDDVSR